MVFDFNTLPAFSTLLTSLLYLSLAFTSASSASSYLSTYSDANINWGDPKTSICNNDYQLEQEQDISNGSEINSTTNDFSVSDDTSVLSSTSSSFSPVYPSSSDSQLKHDKLWSICQGEPSVMSPAPFAYIESLQEVPFALKSRALPQVNSKYYLIPTINTSFFTLPDYNTIISLIIEKHFDHFSESLLNLVNNQLFNYVQTILIHFKGSGHCELIFVLNSNGIKYRSWFWNELSSSMKNDYQLCHIARLGLIQTLQKPQHHHRRFSKLKLKIWWYERKEHK